MKYRKETGRRRPREPFGEARLTRRQALAYVAVAVAAGVPALWLPRLAGASPKAAKKRLAELTGGVAVQKGRVMLILPEITDQKDFVPVRVTVQSPMTEADYVKSIHIVAERNPDPAVASYYLNPGNGKAEISARIRLTRSQVVAAAALMSDGSVFVGKARAKISTGAGGCG